MRTAAAAVTGDAALVLWHDLECGGYDIDLPLWRELADAARGPVLDVGAGTGRVAIDLAARGIEVTALDLEPALLRALGERARARGLDVGVVGADAADFTVPGARFHLVLVPMQTLQLLPGAAARAGFLRSVRGVLAPGGLVACALADALDAFDEEHTEPPLPDMREIGGVVYASRPVAVRDLGDRIAIDRIRETVDGAGRRVAVGNTVVLHALTAEGFSAEAAALGWHVEPPRSVAQTEEYVGSQVVVLRG
jgi:SAM-dependent methyltransferase